MATRWSYTKIWKLVGRLQNVKLLVEGEKPRGPGAEDVGVVPRLYQYGCENHQRGAKVAWVWDSSAWGYGCLSLEIIGVGLGCLGLELVGLVLRLSGCGSHTIETVADVVRINQSKSVSSTASNSWVSEKGVSEKGVAAS